MTVRIGTSGWSYDHWADVLYPRGLKPADRLEHYAREFATVELNASYYRWPREEAFAGWSSRLPSDFAFSFKAHRGLTHSRRLGSPETWADRILLGWKTLGPRPKVLLAQVHPAMRRDDDRLAHFLDCLPGIRIAMELRHPSWDDPAVYAILERYGTAYVVMSGAGLPCVLRATADFVYVRLHGPDPDAMYCGSYSDADLHWWADRITEWVDQGRDVFAYFNNDGKGNAVKNARTLKRILSEHGCRV